MHGSLSLAQHLNLQFQKIQRGSVCTLLNTILQLTHQENTPFSIAMILTHGHFHILIRTGTFNNEHAVPGNKNGMAKLNKQAYSLSHFEFFNKQSKIEVVPHVFDTIQNSHISFILVYRLMNS
jgi:hypothetical protein